MMPAKPLMRSLRCGACPPTSAVLTTSPLPLKERMYLRCDHERGRPALVLSMGDCASRMTPPCTRTCAAASGDHYASITGHSRRRASSKAVAFRLVLRVFGLLARAVILARGKAFLRTSPSAEGAPCNEASRAEPRYSSNALVDSNVFSVTAPFQHHL